MTPSDEKEMKMAFNVEEEMEKLREHMMFAADVLGDGMLSEAESTVTAKWCDDDDAEWWDCQSKLNEANWDEFVEDCKNALWSAVNDNQD